MKETNMEHYRGEIEEIMARHKHCLPAVVDGKPIECEGLRCNKCMLYEATEPCSIHFVKWLMSEYKPEPVLFNYDGFNIILEDFAFTAILEDFGKTVFLTKEEAEAKLKELEE